MSSFTWQRMPFKYRGETDFFSQLDQWIGDVFYDKLPPLGFETREEQIYTTFHMVKALKDKRILFAEAGAGTGKTFAYILTTLCYARLKGMPVVLSSASPVLQDQLTNPKGDLATLSRQLNLSIDARVAKGPNQYVCEVKVERLAQSPRLGNKELLNWAQQSRRGERLELPHITDQDWALISWDDSLCCDQCSSRSGCRYVKARRQLQDAKDFIICEHDVFFKDLWAREELLLRRMVPFLPEYCAVVLDEGHLIELPMAKTLGRELNHPALKRLLNNVTDVDDQRVIVYKRAEELRASARAFFGTLTRAVIPDEHAERMHLRRDEPLLTVASDLNKRLAVLQDELVIEESMNEETPYAVALAAYQEQLDAFGQGLKLLLSGKERSIAWWEPSMHSAFVLPREYSNALHNELFSKKLPVIITSATLAAGVDFGYIQHVTGADQAILSQVGVPFDLGEQVVAYMAKDLPRNDQFVERAAATVEVLLKATGGRTLILCGSPADGKALRKQLNTKNLPFRFLWEGEADRGKLIDLFREDISSVLVGSSFWEGVDVPGEALSQVVIFTLPFPRHDPLVEARRREAREKGLNPEQTVDNPAMQIKLKQGFGRLIRSANDRGLISILDTRPGTETYELVTTALPKGVTVVHDLSSAGKHAEQLLD